MKTSCYAFPHVDLSQRGMTFREYASVEITKALLNGKFASAFGESVGTQVAKEAKSITESLIHELER